LETDPPESNDSTPPEEATDEPVPAVPTRDTNPVWSHTVPVTPAESSQPPHRDLSTDEALPALPMQKGDPDWTEAEPGSEALNGSGGPVPVKKTTPEWAQTVPTSPGEKLLDESGDAPNTDPPKSVAADARKSTWPPSSEAAPAPPQETDIWPPEPPTERAMPAWPPSSELKQPVPPPEAIPTWPESFDSADEAPPHEPAAPDAVEETVAKTSTPPSIPLAAQSDTDTEPSSDSFEAESEPVAAHSPGPSTVPLQMPTSTHPTPAPVLDSGPPSGPIPSPVTPSTPRAVQPSQPGMPTRPTWAPAIPLQAAQPAPPKVESPPPIQIPTWAPKISTAAEPTTSQPGTPTWFSPKEEVRHTSQSIPQPIPEPEPPPMPIPASGGHLPVAQVPVAPIPVAPVPPVAQPPQAMPTPAATAQPGAAKGSWEVVEQPSKSGPHAKVAPGPTAEDRSYAEWFAWAKRGGAPASACHAAAQGAFAALTSGKDVATAVQWATAAMSRPPAAVSYQLQTYCAWFSLANIDLSIDQHQSHAFATAAIAALDAGMDAAAAHAAGLAAAGIR
jgi:hypothetical protein